MTVCTIELYYAISFFFYSLFGRVLVCVCRDDNSWLFFLLLPQLSFVQFIGMSRVMAILFLSLTRFFCFAFFRHLPANWEYYFAFIESEALLSVCISHFYSLFFFCAIIIILMAVSLYIQFFFLIFGRRQSLRILFVPIYFSVTLLLWSRNSAICIDFIF